MTRLELIILITFGCLALVAIAFPTFIIFGFFFFLVPGYALLIAPSAFVYYALFIFARDIFRHSIQVRFPAISALFTLLVVGVLISLSINLPIYMAVDDIRKLDVGKKEEIIIPDTLAMYSSHNSAIPDNNPYKNLCNKLCKNFLINNVASKVLVLDDLSKLDDPDNHSVVSYEFIRGGVEKKWAKLSEADAIFMQGKYTYDIGILSSRISPIRYIEWRVKSDNLFETTYRLNYVFAKPLVYPMLFGHTVGRLSRVPDFGFYHTTIKVNNYNAVVKHGIGETFGASVTY